MLSFGIHVLFGEWGRRAVVSTEASGGCFKIGNCFVTVVDFLSCCLPEGNLVVCRVKDGVQCTPSFWVLFAWLGLVDCNLDGIVYSDAWVLFWL